MKIEILTIFPGMLEGPFGESMIRRAVERGLVEIEIIDLRSFASGRHRQVDDAPYGGGRGMVFKPEPLFKAVETLQERSGGSRARVILLTPQGRTFNQEIARELSGEKRLLLICGRYEGVDERVREVLVDDEISIGDYILTGGELAAAVVVDAVVRLLPGFLEEASVAEESFSGFLLDTHIIPGRLSSGGWRCRRCSCRVIMQPSPAGGGSRRCSGPGSGGRICSRRRHSRLKIAVS